MNDTTGYERMVAELVRFYGSDSGLAEAMNVERATVCRWRLGRREPRGAALRLLEILHEECFEDEERAGAW